METLEIAMEAREISILKTAKFMAANWDEVAALLSSKAGIEKLERLLAKHCAYEKRRRVNYAQELANALNPDIVIKPYHLNNARVMR